MPLHLLGENHLGLDDIVVARSDRAMIRDLGVDGRSINTAIRLCVMDRAHCVFEDRRSERARPLPHVAVRLGRSSLIQEFRPNSYSPVVILERAPSDTASRSEERRVG